MSAATPLSHLHAADYLRVERTSVAKHELFDGQLVAMAGGSLAHNEIATALAEIVRPQVRPRGCHTGSSDTKVGIPERPTFLYPDFVVYCETPQVHDRNSDVLLNPTAVFEVLSPSTESLDRGPKADAYRTIASLTTLVLISQDEPRVQWQERNGDFWALREAVGMDAVASLSQLNVTIPLARLYDGISFPPVRSLLERRAAAENGVADAGGPADGE